MLATLSKYHLLPSDDVTDLATAYCFLRDIEHRLQMRRRGKLTPSPQTGMRGKRLAALMGAPSLIAFEKKLPSTLGASAKSMTKPSRWRHRFRPMASNGI